MVYDSGQVITPRSLRAIATFLSGQPEIPYLHLGSAYNNCYMCQIDPA